MIESLLFLIVVVVLCGVLLWAINTYIFAFPPPIMAAIAVLVLVLIVWYLLGYGPPFGRLR